MTRHISGFIFLFHIINCEITLNFTRRILSLDGHVKSAIFINDIWPGPDIRANKGEILIIRVINSIKEGESITVHWHGVNQDGTNWSDGVPYVTNCPILYQQTFKYVFRVLKSGTFWYHTHDYGHSEGGYGLLIVNDTSEMQYEERKVILSDWYHASSLSIKNDLLRPGKLFEYPGVGDNILINHIAAGCETVSINETIKLKKAVIEVEQGRTYKFRIVNVAAASYFNIAIAGHPLTVIAWDATATQPMLLNSLDIAPGQRFDILLTTNLTLASYTIKVITNWRGNDTSNAGIGCAVLQYKGATSTSLLDPLNESKDWGVQQRVLKPLLSSGVPTTPNDQLIFQQRQQFVNISTYIALSDIDAATDSKIKSAVLKWTLNGYAQKESYIPLLQASYYQILDSELLVGPAAARPRKKLELNDVIDIIIQNRVADNGVCEQHPWHIHGLDMWLIGQGEGEFDLVSDPVLFNTENPIKVNTFVLYPTVFGRQRGMPAVDGPKHAPCGWVAVRIAASNAGIWAFHCHIIWHSIMGMSTTFDVASERLWASTDKELPEDYGVCGG